MFNNYFNVDFEEIFANISKISLFLIILMTFCVIILTKIIFKRSSAVSPKGKAVLITGCDTGFGYQLALKLNYLGYRVYATVLSGDSAHNLIHESKIKDQMVVWKMDVTLDEDVEEVYHKVREDLGIHDCVLWAVVNNAGYGILAQLEWIDLADYKRLFEVNVFGMIHVTKMFLPLLRESKGRLVNQSSILGLETLNGYGAYCMTKYAVSAFTRTLRREVHKFGIKVVVLYPGGYKNTNFIESTFKSFGRIWDQLEDSLKITYGNQEYFEMWKRRQTFAFNYLMSDKTELVINDMVDAVTSARPKSVYKPIGWTIGQILTFFLPIVPSSLVDILDSY